MKNSYRRRPPGSRLERLLTKLVSSQHQSSVPRIDFAHADDIEFNPL